MNFNSTVILCLSSIDICQPTEFHSLDLFCVFLFKAPHGNATEDSLFKYVANIQGCGLTAVLTSIANGPGSNSKVLKLAYS